MKTNYKNCAARLWFEILETRLPLAFAVVAFDTATSFLQFNGDQDNTFDDALELSVVGGFISHNATAGDYASSTDVDPSPLVAHISAGPTTTIRILGGFGEDTVSSSELSSSIEFYGGDGDDFVDASGQAEGALFAAGGAGDDVLIGANSAGPKRDTLFGGDGDDLIEGGVGDDELYGDSGRDRLLGGVGNDILEGGNDGDLLVTGTGRDEVDGGSGLDKLSFEAPGGFFFISAAGLNVSVIAASDGSNLGLSGATGIEDLRLTASDDTPSTFQVNDLTTSSLITLGVELAGGLQANETLTLAGSAFPDVVAIGETNVYGFVATAVQLPWGIVALGPSAPASLIKIDAGAGDDYVSIENAIGNFLGAVTIEGGPGNDQIDAFRSVARNTALGGAGDDVVLPGAFTSETVGGEGFDTVVVTGSNGNNQIAVSQLTVDSLSYDVDGFANAIAIGDSSELVRIEAKKGSDSIRVFQADNLAPADSLRLEIIGEDALPDRLVVVDDATGDLVVHRPRTNDSGSVVVGRLAPVQYQGISRTDFAPLNTLNGATGDGGRLLTILPDPFESNETRFDATLLGNSTYLRGLSIDPGPIPAIGGRGDEDWFEYTATKTGIFRISVLFNELSVLPSGRGGLPNNGSLDVLVYSAEGSLIATSTPSAVNEFVDISVSERKTYYIRVVGFENAVNAYDLAIQEVDLAGPRVTSLGIATAPHFDIFTAKPITQGPTPATKSLSVTILDETQRAPGDLYAAIDENRITKGMISLIGDHTGFISIDSIVVLNDQPVVGAVASATLIVNLSDYLPDDRYTLTISDGIVDPAGNRLDGESSASTPQPIVLPSGNGQAGGNFVARFTVDSRPEIGASSEGLVYVDINGNLQWDTTGKDNDATNRDLVFQFGQLADANFAGNFAAVGAVKASGFDKLGAYGKFGNSYSFLLDTNDDGVGDFSSPMPSAYQVNGIPVAGNFSAAHPGDEIGLFDGSYWYLDANGNNRIDVGERWASNFNGLPLVGDFNGDGSDDLATFNNATNAFVFDTNRDGNSDYTWNVQDAVKRFTGLSGFSDRPVTGDLNLDGIDDIGLWVTDRAGTLPRNSGEFFFWVSDSRATNPSNVFSAYSPAPLGNDLFAEFGDDFALPIFGNFDPPVTNAPSNENPLHNGSNPLDTNGDGFVSAIDALLVINVLNLRLDLPANDPVRAFATVGYQTVDVSGDQAVSALDALLVINALNNHVTGAAEGEQSISTSRAKSVDAAFAELDTWELDAFKRKRLNATYA